MKIHISFDDNTDDNTEPYIEFENVEEEEYHRWLEEQHKLPEEKPSDWFATQKAVYEQEEKSVSNVEREELIQRLKAMAEEEVVPSDTNLVMTCYYPISETQKFTCPRCGRIALEHNIRGNLHAIISMVEEMKQLGYDAKIERVCSICSGNSGMHPLDVDTLFYFRFKGMETYHVTVANHSPAYKVVLDFLRSKNPYYDSKYKDIIEDMLGIKI